MMTHTLEYLFYRQEYCDQFLAFLKQYELSWIINREPIQDAIVVLLNEQEIASIWDQIDDYYDELAEREAESLESDAEDDNVSTAGIHIQLAAGNHTIAKVDPRVLKRILAVVSHDDFAQFIDTIVSSVEQPDDSPICHIPED